MPTIPEIIPEKTILAYLKARVKALGGQVLRLPTQFYRSWPDAVVLLPGAKIGFLELKRTKQKPTDGQLHVLGMLSGWGFPASWTDSKAGVDSFLATL